MTSRTKLHVPALLVLLKANLRSHPARHLAAMVAIAATAAVLLSALAGRNAVSGSAAANDPVLGDREIHLAATDTVFPYLDESLLREMRRDPLVAELHTAVSARAVEMPGTMQGTLDEDGFYSQEQGGMGGWIVGRRDNFLAWDDDQPGGVLVAGQRPTGKPGGPIEISVPVQLPFGKKLGSWRRLEGDSGVHAAQVVGQVRFPASILMTPQGARIMARQISRAAAEVLNGGPRPPSDARIHLRAPGEIDAFLARWRERLPSLPGRMELWDNNFIQQSVTYSAAAQSIRMAAVAAVLMACVCAACIGLAVQGNAARERAAQGQLLRSLGAGRGMIITLLVIEAVAVACGGFVLALAFCWGGLSVARAWFPFLASSPSPGALQVVLALGVIVAGVLAGSVGPVISAWSIDTTNPATAATDPERARLWSRRAALASAAVVLFVTLALIVTPAGSFERSRVLLWIGLPGVALACVLIAPLAVRLTAALLARPVAWATRVEPLVLFDQVAADGPRSAGAIVAIAVGLGTFVWVMCWGASMLNSFVIDERLPRWLISVHPYGLDRSETETVLKAAGLEEFEPLTLVDTRLSPGPRRDTPIPTLLIGVHGLREGSSRIPFTLVAGNLDSVMTDVDNGTGCLLSDWYAHSANVAVGDEVSVAVPGRLENGSVLHRTYRVAGIVELRGWRMATKQNKVRLRGDKHRAMVVLDAKTVRRDFFVSDANYLLGWTRPAASAPPSRYGAGTAEPESYQVSRGERLDLERQVSALLDLDRPIRYSPDGGAEITLSSRVVQVDDLDRARSELLGNWGGGAVRKMGWLPMMALAISLFSVAGSLAVSLQARSRELGILRSCGMTRFGLLRLAIAESVLVTLAAVVVAGLFGAGQAWLMLQLASIIGYHLDFAGIRPEFTVPWEWMVPGALMTAAVCGLAALWAGWRIGRLAPAGLLSGSMIRS
ncbi:FtsX-like permease family protein [Caulifigura coniformis]|uniref:FtsX-like permease family protein n=1 Tax=Caulifigura coniformis TaxID=2527983 RepID=A0A517SI28_9PLAN|nr:ABC transporter permease [Caulifigura coniformis]QDT55767.1 FtsX-like permease family protein [Caulifigura coniformis]